MAAKSPRLLPVLALFAAPAVVAYTLTGQSFNYQNGPVETPFEFNPESFNEGTEADAYAAWQDALDTWNLQGGADLYLQDGGTTTANSFTDDSRYIGQWHSSTNDRYTLAVAQYYGWSGRTSDCDIRFYGRNGSGTIYWNMDEGSIDNFETDFRDVAIHEIGHCLGLGHSNRSQAIMYASSTVGTAVRNLDQDDIDGVVALYGESAPRIRVIDATLDDDPTGPSDGDGDGTIERGEVFELDLDVENYGNVNATGVDVTADESDPDILTVTNTAGIGNVSVGNTGSTQSPLVFEVADDCDQDFTVTLDLTFTDGIGRTWFDAVDVDVFCVIDNDGDGVAFPTDCDDTDSSVYPGAADTPYDGVDSDCDGASDYDADGDGGDSEAYGGTDCDDTDPNVYFGAQEVCDPNDVDEDCDGSADDADNSATGQTVYYFDDDGDGIGVAGTTQAFCDPSPDWVSTSGDCDDGDVDVYPGAPELCDAIDNDCDSDTDEGASGTTTWYADTDGDGQGDANNPFDACAQPQGYVADDRDCDDSSDQAFVGGTEECDDLDNDCDNSIDEDGSNQRTFYADADGDGYGVDGDTDFGCAAPQGYASANGDCAPNDPSIHPGAQEICDVADVDEDCDNAADDADPEGATGTTTVYADTDGDGVGAGSPLEVCDPTGSQVADNGDCQPTDGNRYPGAPELCNNLDDDCDSITDENAGNQTIWYEDGDNDGYGDPNSTTTACDQPSGYTDNNEDCNDGTALMYPGRAESCDSLDNDCDTTVDEDGTNTRTFYEDSDGDGYGLQNSTTQGCAEPAGYSRDFGDCDDTDPNVNPGAQEVCDEDNVDEDCDGAPDNQDLTAEGTTRVYRDRDRDGYGNDDEFFDRCDWSPNDFTEVGGDCNDLASAIHPNADETCNEVDDDCDTTVDENAVNQIPSYIDTDGDGYGEDSTEVLSCDPPAGNVFLGGDCDETDDTVNPGEQETCADGDDKDCDGSVDEDGVPVTWYDDADGDGYGDDTTSESACAQPNATSVLDGGDCDDGSAIAYPDAPEACNRADDDCDDATDEGLGGLTLYEDADGDGFGDPDSSTNGCPASGVWVQNSDDCDDTNAAINPNADEVWYDGVDDDCDGNDDDQDGDGVAFEDDCDDLDPTITDCDTGDPTTDTGEGGGDDSSTDEGGACGCQSTTGAAGLWFAPLLLLLGVRRRRSA